MLKSSSMYTPDSLDEQLLRLLAIDARQSTEELAKKLDISGATVRRRLKRLIDGDFVHIIGVVDPALFGFPLAVIIAFNVTPNKIETAMEKLEKMPEIKWASTTTGRFDIIARAQFRTTEEFSDFIRKNMSRLDGLNESETFLCLDMGQHHYIPFS
jgi:Lrp/AsnC family transcriptional regulator, regulator for asnA, asnC and gidA